MSSERRAGPGATYLDPFILGGVEVSRGPGSVAYGSDAFGGVISARTRDVAPGAPAHVEAIGDYGLGIPGGRVGVAVTSPIGQEGGILVAGHYRSYGNYDSPDGEVLNSGYRDTGVLVSAAYILGPGTLTAGWQGDYARDIGIPSTKSVSHAQLLSRGELEPLHPLVRNRAGRRLFAHCLPRVHRLQRLKHGDLPLFDRARRRVGEGLSGPHVRRAVRRPRPGAGRPGSQRPIRTASRRRHKRDREEPRWSTRIAPTSGRT